MTVTIQQQEINLKRQIMSYEDYLQFASDAPHIIEWANGEAIIHMPPLFRHQDVVTFLAGLLRGFATFFDLGVVIVAPFEVKLWEDGPAREPDVLFISRAQQNQLSEQRFAGGPDLVVEVISPSSATEDRGRKFADYQQAGVREYWLIDPRATHQRADFYVLDNSVTFQAATIDANGRYYATVLPDFWLKVDWLWQKTLPNPQIALTQLIISIEGLEAYQRRIEASLTQDDNA